MKIPDDIKEEVISGLLPLLDPEAIETIEEIQKVDGSVLLNKNIFKTNKGKSVFAGVQYDLLVSRNRKINHRQRIAQIIADSNTSEEWQTRLAEHLAKYATNPAFVTQSIPANLSLQNMPKNDN